MCQPLFFFDHQYPELGGDEENQSSKVNKEEAKMVVQLTNYLLRHGYSGEDLTILTPYGLLDYIPVVTLLIIISYVGQLLELRKQLSLITVVKVDEKDEAIIEKLFGDDEEENPHQAYAMLSLSLLIISAKANRRKEKKDHGKVEKMAHTGKLVRHDKLNNNVRLATIDKYAFTSFHVSHFQLSRRGE